MTAKELRELDAWIAEHVMGQRICHAASSKGNDYWWNAYGGESGGCVMRGMESFAPSEKPSDAMEVLKKCAEKDVEMFMGGNVIQVWRVVSKPEEDGWRVARVFARDGSIPVPDDLMTDAPTLELAICLFAKKLFGGQP